jgi:cardiolipin synthase (CMP-forming)
MNVPNLLTLARLFLTLPICALVLWGGVASVFAFALYLIAAVTDWLDGWWARQYNQGSDFGRMLDPIVDKILVAALFIALAANHTITGIWLLCPIIILAREFLVSGLREYLSPRGITVPVTSMAKWKTTLQMIAVGFLILPFDTTYVIGIILLLVATVLTVMTGFQYFKVWPKN